MHRMYYFFDIFYHWLYLFMSKMKSFLVSAVSLNSVHCTKWLNFLVGLLDSLNLQVVVFRMHRQVAGRGVMTSSKRDVAVSRLTSLLHEWDSGSKSVRRRILQDFVAQNQQKTGPELDAEFADSASLFFTRLSSWLRLTYPSFSSLHRPTSVQKVRFRLRFRFRSCDFGLVAITSVGLNATPA